MQEKRTPVFQNEDGSWGTRHSDSKSPYLYHRIQMPLGDWNHYDD